MKNLKFKISCQRLADTDYMNKADPYVKVSQVDVKSGKLELLGKTEVIYDNLCPSFTTPVHFSVADDKVDSSILEFEVKDKDKIGAENIGFLRIDLSLLVEAGAKGLELPLVGKKLQKNISTTSISSSNEASPKHEKCRGLIFIQTYDMSYPRINLKIKGSNIRKMDTLSESDPFLKLVQSGKILYKSEIIDNNKNPEFKEVILLKEEIPELEKPVWIYCYDDDGKRSDPQFIGECYFVVDQVIDTLSNYSECKTELLDFNLKSAGEIHFDSCVMVE